VSSRSIKPLLNAVAGNKKKLKYNYMCTEHQYNVFKYQRDDQGFYLTCVHCGHFEMFEVDTEAELFELFDMADDDDDWDYSDEDDW
jgi:hypothetical protein